MNATASITDRTRAIGAFDGMPKRAACRVLEAILAVGATPGLVFGRRPLAISCTMTMLQTALLLLAPGAQAQSNACDLLKSELAARIDATGVRGYSLEAVPADTPVPPGAKAIGNCEAGASKILYRRWAAAQPSSADAGATGACLGRAAPRGAGQAGPAVRQWLRTIARRQPPRRQRPAPRRAPRRVPVRRRLRAAPARSPGVHPRSPCRPPAQASSRSYPPSSARLRNQRHRLSRSRPPQRSPRGHSGQPIP